MGKRQPSTAKRQPSTAKRQPSTAKRQPSTATTAQPRRQSTHPATTHRPPPTAHAASRTSHAPHASAPDGPTASTTYPLYDPAFERDACGTGLVANTSGARDHAIIQRALTALANMAHRGAMDADAQTSDGVGVMTHLPYALLADWLTTHAPPTDPRPSPHDLALGMFFLPRDAAGADQARDITRATLERRGLRILGWRLPPLDLSALGAAARDSLPRIEQAIIQRSPSLAHLAPDDLEQLLFLTRKEIETQLTETDNLGAYIVSLSARTVVYKGLLTAAALPHFYTDLRDPHFESAFALFHQRYSTNTFPSWRLAQPMRLLAHNGEINTIQGNRNWMAVRQASELEARWGAEARWLHPLLQPIGSDSTSLDNALELLTRSGRALPDALTLLIPPAWESHDELGARARAFFAARAPMMEPWDGPAALVFSDGRIVGAALDRNGLRPLRYTLTADGLLVVASEAGVIELDEARVLAKGRLGPGQTLILDLEHTAPARLPHDTHDTNDTNDARDSTALRDAIQREDNLITTLAARHPYAKWGRRRIVAIPPLTDERPHETASAAPTSPETLLAEQARFGYSHEDSELILRPMVSESAEAVWSMGDDTPLSILSTQPRPFSSYFKQRFAQVTNPPIDPLREQMVMSLTTYLGPRPNPFISGEPAGAVLRLASPVLDDTTQRATLSAAHKRGLSVATLSASYQPAPADASDEAAATALHAALHTLETQAVAVVRDGARLLHLTDRALPAQHAPLPQPLALAAVHQALARVGLRLRVGLLVETGAVWDTHQIALLIASGANAVHPHLALAAARATAGSRGLETLTPAEASARYLHAIEKGLLKIMARMGLSVLESYLGSGLFESLGVDPTLIEHYFPGMPISLGGLTLAHLDRLARAHLDESTRLTAVSATSTSTSTVQEPRPAGREPRLKLTDRGYIRFRRNAEYHASNPQIVQALQTAAQSGDPDDYQRFADLTHSRPPTAIRDLLTLAATTPIALSEVEPARAIVQRFISTAMSLGALSPEAHLTLTLGANRVGARSNTGEGGEDPDWQTGTRDGVSMNSRIKQIASARFGVTTAYLARAEELEIKMAQGSKPGEGGQLPARKVSALIARLRHTAVNIPLISPPPHHDIYSIEDLAQLIYDLKQVNPRAAVGVKLVSARGVGAVAAGVAKAHADYILISGHDGGTGASPLSSIKSVGSPWELGLAEAQQTLRHNGLRGRVRLRTDGGLKTGRDVIIAALLGADEFGFGSAALIAIGCDMARQCHLDTCPTGIATQRDDLRRKFAGRPEHIANYLLAVAEDVRRHLAQLGARTLDEIIGRPDLLATLPAQPNTPPLDLSALLATGDPTTPRRRTLSLADERAARETAAHAIPESQILDDAANVFTRGASVTFNAPIRNSDRAAGARLAGEIARRWGDDGLPNGAITYHYTGSAGQSFGAFCTPGLRLELRGEANDYVGKGMTGGEIIIAPSARATFIAAQHVILGNTALYGATGGLLLARGQAGERFAVRNSGAVAVVEGVGDHCAEYMTGGAIVTLGPAGRNFAAGMSGGVAYVYDEHGAFPPHLNAEMAHIERLTTPDDIEDLATLLRYHRERAGSDTAARLLATWPTATSRFWRILPRAGAHSERPLAALLVALGLLPQPYESSPIPALVANGR